MVRQLLWLGAVVFALCLGCNQSPPAEKADADAAHDHDHDHAHEGHDHGAVAKTYHEAVEKIEAARDSIRDRLAAGDKDKADETLHELGHVLEQLPELAKSLAAEEQEAVKKDTDELFDLFGKLDEQIHGNLEVTYEAYSEKIDAAVERLHERAGHDHAEEK